MKECDDYADIFGIEMIPCIQTLAHLIDVLKWPVYWDMRDDEETLLVGEEKAYKFIEDLIVAASAPFRTKRIHIGMDEAWRLGLGAYLERNGLRKKFDIMNEHLARVLKIVEKHGLEPMIWSDMYFRAASKTGDYYDLEAEISYELASTVPKGVQLVYWDYYHDNEDFYIEYIKRHRKFGSDSIFAGGIWTWTGFNANWGKTFNTTNPALNACKKEGIREVFVTIWGDNGTESNVFSNLLGLQLFAEHGYAKELDMDKLRNRFEFCTGCNYDDFMSIKYLDEVPGTDKDNMENYNPSKYLMWQDLLTGLFDKNIEGLPLNEHYEKLTKTFENAIKRNGEYGFLFEYLTKVSYVLSIKSEIGIKITEAYRNGNKTALQDFVDKELPELKKRVKDLRKTHKQQWFKINKALGWDIMDMRYGSLLIRIQSAIEQIKDYLDGKSENIEELEQERLSFTGKPGLVRYANYYGLIVSASRIAPKA
ncbi:MAG TPA: beta-N-acetylhexosaminidase [Clostridiales bacterium]|nr:beta-N-acetylhexosaminidase [Clostridiales bacterium]